MDEPAKGTHQETIANTEAVRRLEPPARAAALSRMAPAELRTVFEQLEPALQEEVIAHLRDPQVHRLVEDLDPDDRVRLLEQLPKPVSQLLLARLSPHERRLTHKLLGFPEESAGRIMNPEYLPLAPEWSAAEALEHVRRQGRQVETVNVLPVLGEGRRLLGLMMLSDLVLADPAARVADLMVSSPPSVGPEADQEEVARLLQAADLLALPVLDDDGQILGLITVDDAMDVLQSEIEEDIARAGASEPLDRPYLSVSVFRLTRARFVWLLLLALAGALTVNVLNAFESVLDEVVTLSLFIPLLIGVGGNSGAQAATTIIRAMTRGDLEGRGPLPIVLRETRVGLLLGTAIAALAYFPVMLFFNQPLATTVGLALITICTGANLVGAGMPLIADRVGIDPAVVSAPVVTTLVDALGLLAYFLIARAVMGI